MKDEVRTLNGYALDVECHVNRPVGYPSHGGNRGLVRGVGGTWECQGCGSAIPESQVLAEQREAAARRA